MGSTHSTWSSTCFYIANASYRYAFSELARQGAMFCRIMKRTLRLSSIWSRSIRLVIMTGRTCTQCPQMHWCYCRLIRSPPPMRLMDLGWLRSRATSENRDQSRRGHEKKCRVFETLNLRLTWLRITRGKYVLMLKSIVLSLSCSDFITCYQAQGPPLSFQVASKSTRLIEKQFRKSSVCSQ